MAARPNRQRLRARAPADSDTTIAAAGSASVEGLFFAGADGTAISTTPVSGRSGQRFMTIIMIAPWPETNGSNAFPITVPGVGSTARIACPGVAEATNKSPTPIAP